MTASSLDFRIYKTDPLLKFLRDKLRLHPIVFGGVVAALQFLLGFSYASLTDRLTLEDRVGLLEDLHVFVNIIGTFTALAVYLWLPSGLKNIFIRLYQNNLIGNAHPQTLARRGEQFDYLKFLEELVAILNKRIWIVLPMLVLIPTTIWGYRDFLDNYRLWWSDNPYYVVYVLISNYIQFVIVAKIVFQVLVAVYFLVRLFREFEIVYRPHHPDRSGGMGSIGEFATIVAYMAAAFGVVLVVNTFTQEYAKGADELFSFESGFLFYITLAMYSLVVPIIFIIPLRAAHRVMKAYRDQELAWIDERIQLSFQAIKGDAEIQAEVLGERMDEIEHYEQLRKLVTRFPVYPSNIANLIRFGVSSITPLLLAVISPIIDILLF